jgi:hypothetical protein
VTEPRTPSDCEREEARRLGKEFPSLVFRQMQRVGENYEFMRCQAVLHVPTHVIWPAIPRLLQAGEATCVITHILAVAATWKRLREILNQGKGKRGGAR